MEEWEENHIRTNLAKLIQITNCRVDLLACLSQIFDQHDFETVECRRTPQEKANELYRTAIQKVNGYYEIALALQKTKRTGALKIILEGYKVNDKPIPEELKQNDLFSDELKPDFKDMVMGDDDCPKSDVLASIKGSANFDTLGAKWKSVARCLEIPATQIEELSNQYEMGFRVKTLDQLIDKLLSVWKNEKGDHAKIVHLCNAFKNCQLTDTAEALSSKFGKRLETRRNMKRFLWQGKLVTLKDLLGKEDIEKPVDIMNEERKVHQHRATPIIKDELTPPAQSKHYVPRTLSYIPSTELDSAIFFSKSTKDHVFLFKGISKPDLAKLTRYQAIEMSGDQLNNVTVRFIMLLCDEDYDRICKNTSSPVHVIQHTGTRYYWVKSSKRVDIIQQFLKRPRQHISEEELITDILSTAPPCALSIADTPGMGKTLLLANLANKIQQQPRSIVLFIVLQEFFQQQQQQLNLVNSNFSVIDAIAEFSSHDQTTKRILTEMIRSEINQLYLFLDGYDELTQDKLEIFDSFLKHFNQELRNMKLIITTRPHLKTRLELIFNKFSYEIQPFNESNQIEFLTNYWMNQHESLVERDLLKEFARQCLKTLKMEFTVEEREIAGIPLQCMILGEVYAEYAMRACRIKTPNANEAKSISFFEMYKTLILLKFNGIPDLRQKRACVHAHVHLAIALLFPEWSVKLKPFLEGWDKINDATLYSVGLVENSPSPNAPRFIHRTFAEYLLAEFIVNNLGKHNVCVDLLFGEIFGEKGTIVEEDYFPKLPNYQLKYPVIGYFIDMHLKQHSIDKLLLSNYSPSASFNLDDVCVTIQACCSNDYENLFNYATKLLHNHFSIGEQQKDQYFKTIAHVVTRSCKNVRMLDKVLKLMELKFGVDLSYHVRKSDLNDFDRRLPDFTPLHTAMFEGKYSMASYLVGEYGDQVNKLEGLLHACLYQSAENSYSVIQEKLLIVDMLTAKNRNCINENLQEEGFTPLLQVNVHLSLLIRLVELGADINAYTHYHGTLLHASNDKKTFPELLKFATSNRFKLINHTDRHKRTPLMHAIRWFGTLEDPLLRLFHEAGADFNAQDNRGYSVLFYAIEHSGNVIFIRKLQEYGADVNHKNRKNQNALHEVMQLPGSTEGKLLIIDMLVWINRKWIYELDDDSCTPLLRHNGDLRLLKRLVHHGANINAYSWKHGTVLHATKDRDAFSKLARWAFSNGFSQVNYKGGWNKRTALMHAIESFGTVEDEVMEMFRKAGTDFNAQDKRGDSVLFYALQWSYGNHHCHFIRKLLEYGAKVNHTNENMQNAAHKVILNWKLDCYQRLGALKLLESEGFDQFTGKDLQGITSLELARRKRNMDKDVIEFLQSKSNVLTCSNGSGHFQRAGRFAKSTPSLYLHQGFH